MTFSKILIDDLGVLLEAAAYLPQEGVAEWHVMLHVEPRGQAFAQQLQRVYAAEERLSGLPGFEGAVCVMKRYFLSDSTNQQPLMRSETGVSLSLIQQQPLDGSKLAVWLYLQRGTRLGEEHGCLVAEHNGYRHLWQMGLTHPEGGSAHQTEALLRHYGQTLARFQATLADHCVRTWFFVRDVDTQYAGLVEATSPSSVRNRASVL